MIKYFCDRCGKEIKENGYTDTVTTEAVDCCDNVVATWTSTTHICNECHYDGLTCGFKVGDKVITNDGRIGFISEICDCESCKKRGFYEPTVTFKDGTVEYIMISDKNNGFKSYYQIGDRVFGNLLDEESIDKEVDEAFERYTRLIRQLGVIRSLKYKKIN